MRYAKLKPSHMSAFSDRLHADDRERVEAAKPLHVLTLLECASLDGRYTVVRRTLAEAPFRLLSEALELVPTPKFRLGEVALSRVDGPPEQVAIFRLEFHVKRGHEVYLVIRSGKPSGRRYLPDELASLGERRT